MSEPYLPTARKSKLVVRELADEILVYDADGHRAHCLNRTAALVWKHCDGRTPASGIAERVAEELSFAVSEEVVWLALDQLAEFDLLMSAAVARSPVSNLISRRKMIRRLGIAAAVALPLITSIVSPTPAQAQSPCTETSCPPGTTCQAGICEPDT
ncbi:MAG: hypothetical protein QOC99_225 [Acidobacteriota bacterium]|jgi:hypothetical protein|nr:hypothetical protein [Acidobacteriota bacterium]